MIAGVRWVSGHVFLSVFFSFRLFCDHVNLTEWPFLPNFSFRTDLPDEDLKRILEKLPISHALKQKAKPGFEPNSEPSAKPSGKDLA